MVAGAGMKLMVLMLLWVLTVGKLSYGCWSWNEADSLDAALVAFLS